MNGDKRNVVESYLEQGETFLVLDSRQAGVDVPDHLRRGDLTLKVSYRYSPGDLSVTDWGVTITLSFGGVRHLVRVPWPALFAAGSTTGATRFWDPPPAPPRFSKRLGVVALVAPLAELSMTGAA